MEAATGERVSALEGIGTAGKALVEEKVRDGEKERARGLEGLLERPGGTRDDAPDKGCEPEREKTPEPKQKSVEMDFGLWGGRTLSLAYQRLALSLRSYGRTHIQPRPNGFRQEVRRTRLRRIRKNRHMEQNSWKLRAHASPCLRFLRPARVTSDRPRSGADNGRSAPTR